MKKLTISFISLISSLVLLLTAVPAIVSASHIQNDSQIPETNGTYDEPGHHGIKVRVIVHKARTSGFAHLNSAPALTCGLSDPDSTTVVPAAGWILPTNVTYRLNPGSVPSTVGGANLPTIAADGFNNWQAASNNKVSFSRGANTTTSRQAYDGQNVIAWGRTSNSALAVTYVRYNTTTHVVVDVDTIVNKSYPWYWSNQANCAYSGVYDAQDILTHELGHWMGLSDTYDASFQNNTMFGYGATQEVKKDTLTSGDTAGVYGIYN